MSDGLMDSKGYAIYDTFLKQVYFTHAKKEKDLFINDKYRKSNNYIVRKIDLDSRNVPDELQGYLSLSYLVNINGRMVTPSEENELFGFPDDMSGLYENSNVILSDLKKLKLNEYELDLITNALKEYNDFIDEIRNCLERGSLSMYDNNYFDINEVADRIIEFSNNADIRHQSMEAKGVARW